MRYQKIESQIWHDEKFIKLSHNQQLLFFYILTSPHNNLLGIYVLKMGYICEDLKMKSVKGDLDKLIEIGLIKYDYETGMVFIPNFLRHNPLTNPNQYKSAVKVWNRLPKCSLLLNIYEGLSEGLRQRLGEGLAKPETEEETETGPEEESEKELSSPSSDKAIKKEIINEVISYLNAKADTNFRTGTSNTRDKIIARINEGFTLDDFKKVIDNKVAQWKHDTKMNAYLRPETLFSPKFESYLNEKPVDPRYLPKPEPKMPEPRRL